uniref:Uncharacterized protein n=1 Tax=Setaria viridis TaxID=4556 RepID=A0A4U6TET6_SETVI|nr:hypothetical protein SEVIR_8G033500v2 [Setaria viridis]
MSFQSDASKEGRDTIGATAARPEVLHPGSMRDTRRKRTIRLTLPRKKTTPKDIIVISPEGARLSPTPTIPTHISSRSPCSRATGPIVGRQWLTQASLLPPDTTMQYDRPHIAHKKGLPAITVAAPPPPLKPKDLPSNHRTGPPRHKARRSPQYVTVSSTTAGGGSARPAPHWALHGQPRKAATRRRHQPSQATHHHCYCWVARPLAAAPGRLGERAKGNGCQGCPPSCRGRLRARAEGNNCPSHPQSCWGWLPKAARCHAGAG